MPPQLPNNQQQNPRHRVVAVMTRAQEDALHQLRRDGVPEGLALAVMQRVSSFCLQTLGELDLLYREYEELLAHNPDRSAAHQAWLTDKATGLLMQVEVAIAALVTETIEKAKADYRTELSQPREVITHVPAPPPRSAWQDALEFLDHTRAAWLYGGGGSIWFLFWTLVTGSLLWGLVAVAVTALVVYRMKWGGLILISIATVVCLIFLL